MLTDQSLWGFYDNWKHVGDQYLTRASDNARPFTADPGGSSAYGGSLY